MFSFFIVTKLKFQSADLNQNTRELSPINILLFQLCLIGMFLIPFKILQVDNTYINFIIQPDAIALKQKQTKKTL